MPLQLAFNAATQFKRVAIFRFYAVDATAGDIRIIRITLEGGPDFHVEYTSRLEHPTMQCPIVEVYGVANGDFALNDITLVVQLQIDGLRRTIRCTAATIRDNFLVDGKFTVTETWRALVTPDRVRTMLDIGGRARSGVSRKNDYPGTKVLVADIMAAPDVDFVADAHHLSEQVKGKFDAFLSMATFEHLIMPWKVAVEINKVLNMGAPGLIMTHQTVGLHEFPWDFFRFSDTAWKGIFNIRTGFEIVDAGMCAPCFITPTQWQPADAGGEDARGFLTSALVVRKIAEPTVDWAATTAEVLTDMYPR